MDKKEIITEVSEKVDLSKDNVEKIFDTFIDTIKDGLNKGERITISGFGTFSLAKRKAREFVNPKTKEVYQIPEKQTPFFKAGSNFFKKVL